MVTPNEPSTIKAPEMADHIVFPTVLSGHVRYVHPDQPHPAHMPRKPKAWMIFQRLPVCWVVSVGMVVLREVL
jgi:hypothetical protein